MTDAAGKVTWTGASSLDLRTVFPDEHTPPGFVDARKAQTHTDRFPGVHGTGALYLQIVDPDGISPSLALSIRGRTEQGAYLLGTLK